MESAFVADLRADLVTRLGVVEEEARRLRHAVRVLDSPARGRVGKALVDELLRELQNQPGTRASMLALVLGRDVAEVQASLQELEATNAVQRDGLGWRVPPAR